MDSDLIDLASAKSIALSFLGQPSPEKDFSFVILDEYIIEREKCFVFFYESSKFLSTGQFDDRLVGNAPILVDRKSGMPRVLGTAYPVEAYIAEFEKLA